MAKYDDGVEICDYPPCKKYLNDLAEIFYTQFPDGMGIGNDNLRVLFCSPKCRMEYAKKLKDEKPINGVIWRPDDWNKQ